MRLAARPMELLVLLVERRSQLVSREEIARSLWPGMEVEDLAARINTAVAQIRAALDDDASRPRYLETVIGKGYRFIAVVEEIPVAALVAAGQSHEAAPAPSGLMNHTATDQLRGLPADRAEAGLPVSPPAESFPSLPLPEPSVASRPAAPRAALYLFLAIAGAALLLSLAGLLHARHASGTAAAPAATWSYHKVTENDTDLPVSASALSSDGRFLAYGDAAGVFVQDLGTSQTRLVPAPPLHAERLAWFAQGRVLLLTGFSTAQKQTQIWTLHPAGGAPQQLPLVGGQDAVPSPDGSKVAYLADDGREIRIAGVHGSAQRTVARASTPGTYSALFWSADSKRISYQQRDLSPNGSVEIESNFEWTYRSREIANGTQTAFLADFVFDSAQESADGRMFFVRSHPGHNEDNRGIWMVQTDADSGRLIGHPQKLCEIPYVVLQDLSVRADGRMVSATRQESQPDVYVAGFDAAAFGLSAERRLTSSLTSDFPHSWDPAGRTVYYESNRAGNRFHLFRQSIDNPAAEMLTAGDTSQFFPIVTGDGKTLVYEQRGQQGQKQERSIFRARPDGTQPSLLWKEGELDEWRCALRAPESCVLRETHGHEQFVFYTLNLVSGRGKELAQNAWVPSVMGDWDLSSDGSEVAIPDHDKASPTIQIVSLRGKAARTIKLDPSVQLWGLHWAADGAGFFAEVRGDVEHRLAYIDMAGHVHTLRVTQGNTWGIPSPDGRKLAFVDSNITRNAYLWQP